MTHRVFPTPPARAIDTLDNLPEVPASVPSMPAEPESGTTAELCGGPLVVPIESRAEFFAGCVLLTGPAKIFCPDGEVRGMTDFNAVFAGFEFAEPFGGRPIKKPWDAWLTSPYIKHPKARDVCYYPQKEFGEIVEDEGEKYVNCYKNTDGPRIAGDATPFLNHVHTILPDGRDAEILLSWLAAFIQYPGVKFMWSPLIQGVEGNGKSLFGRILTHAIGSRHVTDVDPEDLCATGGKFNAWIMDNRLALIEELKTDSRTKAENTLRRLITNTRIQMQAKGVDQVTVRSIINFLITSNHQDAILITEHTRRIAPLFCAQQNRADLDVAGMSRNGDYFKNHFRWLEHEKGWAICAHYLDTYAIPDEFNPAEGCDKAPETSALRAAVSACTTVPAQIIKEAIELEEFGFRGGMVGTKPAERLLRDHHKWAGPQKLAGLLVSLGFRKAPVLSGSDGKILIGNDRQRIYVLPGSPADQLQTADALRDMWTRINAPDYSPVSSIQVVPR